MDALFKIQQELHAPKDLENKFGGYKYRSCESILTAVKPLLEKHNATLIISDDVEEVGGRVYVKSTATLMCEGEQVSVTASAREAEIRKGMDDSQITGATSSYARKYALNGLFLIDDTKDADATNKHDNADQELKDKQNKLRKAQAMALDKLLKYDVMAIQQAFEESGYVSDKDELEAMLSDLVKQVNSAEKIMTIGKRVKVLHDDIENSL